MALAIRFEQLIKGGTVKDQADLARLAHISQARVPQIMDPLLLAPEIQEEILFLPRVVKGRRETCLRDLQGQAGQVIWEEQWRAWQLIRARPLRAKGGSQ